MIETASHYTEKNYYEILGLEPSASQEDIELAYHKLRKRYSGQIAASYSIFSSDEFEKINAYLEQAYCVLSCYEKRKQYHVSKGFEEHKFAEYQENFTLEDESYKSSLFESATKDVDFNYDLDPLFENKIDCLTDFNGQTLKEIREYKNISLEFLAKKTKIMKNYIVAIEEDDSKKLPANVYLRGFIFHYAKTLKLNPDLVSRSYMEKVNQIRKNFN